MAQNTETQTWTTMTVGNALHKLSQLTADEVPAIQKFSAADCDGEVNTFGLKGQMVDPAYAYSMLLEAYQISQEIGAPLEMVYFETI